jgi:DnaJ homolog subfamily B member 6
MHNAEEIFRNFFGGRDPFANFFDDDDDFFGGGFGSMNMGMGSGKRQGGNKQRHDPFGGFGMMSSHFGEDDFFGDSGFGSGGFTSF